MIAASILKASGIHHLVDVAGGYNADLLHQHTESNWSATASVLS
jgi:hypothetical protein